MKRTFVVAALVLGFAAAASASTLTVFTTNASNVAQSTFNVGDTILLKVTGDPAGGVDNGGVFGEIHWNASIAHATAVTMGAWYGSILNNGIAPGQANAFNETNPRTATTIDTSVITLIADAAGTTNVAWGGSALSFFDIYTASPGTFPTGASFTVVPEPATAALVGLGLLGLVLGGRRRA